MTNDPNEPPVTEPVVLTDVPFASPDAPATPELEVAAAEPVDVPVTPAPPPPDAADEEDASPDRPDIEFSRLDPDALKVVHRLRAQGHEAYFVGGCVRDHLVGRKPKDYDIATSAHPNEVRNTFRNCRLIGRRFRLAHVYFKGGKIIEVSTFRASPTAVEEPQGELELVAQTEVEAEGLAEADGTVLNVTHPAEAEAQEDLLITDDNLFGSAEEDARRRDFTINGLFFDVGTGKVVDYVRGLRDLERKFVRTIGDPEVRMREDPIRILRAVRFACRLGFDIESRTYAAMEGAVEDLPRCAPPRLLEDTFRLIRGGVAAPGIRLLDALDALKYLLTPIHNYFREQGPQGEALFYAHAEALDRKVNSGAVLEDAVLLAALLLPIGRANVPVEPEVGGKPSVGHVIEGLLEELVRTARLPRRIAERCRMILFAQRTLSGERRRRGPLGSFRRHPLFQESLSVFELSVEATGEFKEQLESWKSGAVPPPLASAASAGEGAAAPGRKRRRRRRRGPPSESGQAEGPSEPGDSSAQGGSADPASSDEGSEAD